MARKHVPDTTPVHIPGKSDRQAPLSLKDEMRRFVREEVSRMAQSKEFETFEEADDLEIDESDDLTTPYTLVMDVRPEGENPPDDLEGLPDTPVASQGETLSSGDRSFGAEGARARSAETPAPSPGPEPPPSPK